MMALNENENLWADQFIDKHGKCYKKKKAAGKYGYRIDITPTGIGFRVDITCNACGKTKDISDYDNW